MSLLPPVKWAQRADTLFITIQLQDVDKETALIHLTNTTLTFQGTSQGKKYDLSIEFFKGNDGIDSSSEDSKYSIKARGVEFFLVKKKEGFWPRLLEDKSLQKTNVKVDFNKWIDSDDDEIDDFNTSDMDAMGAGMGGMPGMGGPGGMNMEALQKMMANMGDKSGGPPDLDNSSLNLDENESSENNDSTSHNENAALDLE